MIRIVETLGDEVVQRAAQLPQRQLLRLVADLGCDGMEATLEELRDKHRIRFRDANGDEVVLPIPKDGADVAAFMDAVSALKRQQEAARRGELNAEDALASAREINAKEVGALREEIDRLTRRMAEAQGRGAAAEREFLKEKTPTPAEAAKSQQTLAGARERERQLDADLREARGRLEGVAAQLEKRLKAAADVGSLKRTQEICAEAVRKTDAALEAFSDLRAMAPDLGQAGRELCYDTAARCQTQFRQLADEFNFLAEEG